MTGLWDIICQSATVGLELQHEDGSMPPGHNGPRWDIDTPVRNTAHWTITFLKAFELTDNAEFRIAAKRASDYLISEESRPMNAAFWCRINPQKDFSNGLIGQAWVIEALSLATKKLENPEYGSVAKEVFNLHPFDQTLGLWRGINVDGSYRSINLTFNQQLWFATSGVLLCRDVGKDAEIISKTKSFMEKCQRHLHLYRNGLICHTISRSSVESKPIKKSLRWILFLKKKHSPICIEQSIGYHTFNLYAFALLRQQLPEHHFWHSKQIMKALDYIETDEFVKALEQNKYGYAYNPTGFEIAFALEVFADNTRAEQERWVSEQLRRCYDFESHLMSRGAEDPVTLAARLYETTRLPDLTVQIED